VDERAELAERFGLDRGVKVGRMSRGMRQKLGLILTFAHEPKLLVLDEPSSALDPIMQQHLRDYLLERAADGNTVFFSSHTLSEVEDLCGRVAILREGRLVASETLAELRRHASRLVVIRWAAGLAEGDEPPVPTFLELQERRPGSWRCLIDGPVRPLLIWAAAQPIDDLAISEPDLETLFRAYYAKSPDEPRRAAEALR
jgi:ABC-2 type transport system ATP-binding protein